MLKHYDVPAVCLSKSTEKPEVSNEMLHRAEIVRAGAEGDVARVLGNTGSKRENMGPVERHVSS